MSNLLHKLENNEQVLLMYLGGELPPQDAAEVQRMLDTDAGLRAMLVEMEAVHEQTVDHLALLDAAPDPAAEEASIRRTLREMRRFQTEQALRPVREEQPASVRRYPWWMYSAGSVAAAVIIMLGLWGMGVIDVLDKTRPGGNGTQVVEGVSQEVLVAELQRSFGGNRHVAWAGDEAEDHIRALEADEEVLALFGSM